MILLRLRGTTEVSDLLTNEYNSNQLWAHWLVNYSFSDNKTVEVNLNNFDNHLGLSRFNFK